MFIADIELGKQYMYHNGADMHCLVIAIGCDTPVPEIERATVYVQAVTSGKRWVAMPHQLQEAKSNAGGAA